MWLNASDKATNKLRSNSVPDEALKHALKDQDIRRELLERARALAPRLRERAEEGNLLRHAPDATIVDLVAAKLVRICQPARFGGFEQPFSVISEVVMELARGDGSQAWVADVYAEHVYMLALFSDQAQHDVWDENPDALISASIVPPGNKVQKVDGGFVLKGRWPFLSGLHHSHWSILADVVPDGEGGRRMHFFLVPAADRTNIDDWHVMGLAGTGTSSIELKDVFVPGHRVILNSEVAAGKAPGMAVNSNPIYRMPIFGFTVSGLGAVPIGVLAGMVDDFAEYVAACARRPHPPPGMANLTERLAESSVEADAARTMFQVATANYEGKLRAGTKLTDEDAARTMRNVAWANMLARRAATRMFEVTGAHGLFLPGDLQRAFRDIFAAGVHRALNWETSALRWGKMLSGQPADPPPFR